MNVLKKAIVISALVSMGLLILTNPQGTTAAGNAGSGLMTAWFKGLQGRS